MRTVKIAYTPPQRRPLGEKLRYKLAVRRKGGPVWARIGDAGVNTHHLPSKTDKNNKILTAAQGNATIKTNGDATELTYKHSAASSFWIKNH